MFIKSRLPANKVALSKRNGCLLAFTSLLMLCHNSDIIFNPSLAPSRLLVGAVVATSSVSSSGSGSSSSSAHSSRNINSNSQSDRQDPAAKSKRQDGDADTHLRTQQPLQIIAFQLAVPEVTESQANASSGFFVDPLEAEQSQQQTTTTTTSSLAIEPSSQAAFSVPYEITRINSPTSSSSSGSQTTTTNTGKQRKQHQPHIDGFEYLVDDISRKPLGATSERQRVKAASAADGHLYDADRALIRLADDDRQEDRIDKIDDLLVANTTASIRATRDSSGRRVATATGSPASVIVSESNRMESSSHCALILKRTYILKNPASTDEWGDKFVFNDVDTDDVKKKVHKSDLCIKHSDVDKAIEEAKHKIKFEKPDDLDSPEVNEASLAAVAELNLAAGQLLTKKFDLSHDEILNALPMIDMSSSKFFWKDLCPKHVRPMVCIKSRYRTITAHCNNLRHPSWGASKTPYSRYLPPDYADGLTMPRASQSGQPLPSARLITSTVHKDSDEPSNDYSALFASWGQLLNHDVTRVAVGEAPDCCPQYLKGLCMPIPVPQGDPLYSKFNVKCLKFDRSLAAIRPKCLLGLRAQINLITSPVDASFVYGSTKAQAADLRAFSDGKMKVWNYFEKLKLKPLLPPQTEDPDSNCLGRPKNLYCFKAGDARVNEQTHLTVLHTLYIREHNRIAKVLGQMNLEWDDEKIYQETRHIVAASVQHVMSNEFAPLLLGSAGSAEYKIKPHGEGYWPGYDPSVTTSTGTAFAAAAFRYGHSMVESVIKQFDKMGKFMRGDLLRHLFKRPFLLYEPGVLDQLVMGMVLTPSEQTDPFVSEELSGHLFQPPKAKFGHDLAAINIQRGRDQGVPGYNEWREWCGLSRAKSFSDLEPLLMNRTAHLYSRIYKHVDDIDLWSAGVSERKLPGAAVGPTMACIIARQFMNTKRGDRFWYENQGQPSSFTPAQLKEIKKVTLAKILCTNSDDVPKIQMWAMRLPHPIYNAKVPCESLPSINLKMWDSSSMESF